MARCTASSYDRYANWPHACPREAAEGDTLCKLHRAAERRYESTSQRRQQQNDAYYAARQQLIDTVQACDHCRAAWKAYENTQLPR